jgi:hypothetical protein
VRQAAALLALLLLAACQRGGGEDFSDQLKAWDATRGELVAPGVFKLPNGDCLDAARLPAPWRTTRTDSRRSLALTPEPDDVGIEPSKITGLDASHPDLRDGALVVDVTGWTWPAFEPPRPVAAPKVIDSHIAEGRARRLDLWPGRTDLEAWAYAGRFYVDPRRYTQCRDYGPEIPLVWCQVTARDEAYVFAVRLAPSNVARLPQVLEGLTSVVEAMRGRCRPSP